MTTSDTAAKTALSGTGPESAWRRGFWSLIVVQFQGAFSDNALKNLVIFVVLGMSFSESYRHRVGELVGALFALPFILFSLAGGYLADRFSKRSVTIAIKTFEIFVMLFALVGLAIQNLPMQLTAVFFMGMHSAFFGPSKYGLLPELLPEQRLSWGNGIIQMGTNLAVLLGLIAAGWLADAFRGRQEWSGVILVGLAILGLSISQGITRVPAANREKKFKLNPFADFWHQLRLIRKDRVLFLAVLGGTYFSFLGALLLLNLIFYGTDILHLQKSGQKIALLLGCAAVGIGVGAVTAGVLSNRKIEYGLVPLGSFGLTVFGFLLGRPDLSFSQVALNLALLGFFAGFYVVPTSALVQYRPNPQEKGGVLAATNLLSFVGVALASLAHYALTNVAHLGPSQIFLACAFLTLLASIYALYLLPDALLRLLLWMLTHTIYRIRVEGRDNIPERGGALFVCNHVSFVDALLLISSTDRFLRCMMFQDIYDHPLVKPFAKIMRAIPISAHLRPREMIKSLREASEAIKNGEVVCIFAEGQITRIGQLLPFRRGFERIMKNVDAPIIPVCLDGVWGSIFSYEKRRFLWKWPRYVPYPVTVSFGKPMPPTSTPFEVRQTVQDLNSDAWEHRKQRIMTLPRAFVRKARHHPGRFLMADGRGQKLSLGAALTRSVLLARRLKSVWHGQETVGVLLPPSVPAALVNYAAMLMGKVPVNLNYTATEEILASCARQCQLQTVVTSKGLLDKLKIKVPGKLVLIEEFTGKPRLGERLAALILSWAIPAGLLENVLRRGDPSVSSPRPTMEQVGHTGPPRRRNTSLDDLATIIFSSGSTGDPKGVMLTHYNIASNIEQLGQTFAFHGRDRMLGILPFFHSFGYTATLMLPAVLGIGVVYHPNPLDATAIGQLVRDFKITFLLATPTFLQLYTRACEAEDFGSLQFVMAGAEKLPERVALAFEDKFGIRPLEGYGLTECSPAVAVNTRDFRAAGFRQVGSKRGKIGHPLPGVAVRIVDPATMQPLPVNQPGLLLVRGPNVMKGYLGRPEQTAEVLRDGWYITGDIAAIDEDGFLQISDRLTRFSKIGGEMVPHIKVEEKLHELAGATEQSFVVTGLPDESKGERLVVLHTLSEGRLKDCLERLPQSDLPNLWKPRPDQFFRLDSLPYLGTGKLDLRRIRETAAKLSGGG